MPVSLLIIFGFSFLVTLGFLVYYSEGMRKLASISLGVFVGSFFLGIMTLVCVMI